MEKYCDMNGEVCGVSDDAMKLLKKYDWPGNVRELENVIQRALAASSGPTIQPQDLLVGVKGRTGLESSTGENATLREIERRSILQAVKMASGDKLIAARLLGIGKTTLYRKLKRYRAEGKG